MRALSNQDSHLAPREMTYIWNSNTLITVASGACTRIAIIQPRFYFGPSDLIDMIYTISALWVRAASPCPIPPPILSGASSSASNFGGQAKQASPAANWNSSQRSGTSATRHLLIGRCCAAAERHRQCQRQSSRAAPAHVVETRLRRTQIRSARHYRAALPASCKAQRALSHHSRAPMLGRHQLQ